MGQLTRTAIAATALALLLVGAGSAHAQGATRALAAGAYSSAASDFVVGRTVHLRSTKTRIGTVVDTDEKHAFPRTFPRPVMPAVLIRRTDGPLGWVPLETATRIYAVVK